jgi:predicted CoA-substrate-specific enzyme activase
MMIEGWNIGAVSVKVVRLHDDGKLEAEIIRHGGTPERSVRAILEGRKSMPAGAAVTGPQASSILSPPYLPESVCLEAALAHLGLAPDMVLSLGGESFVVCCIAGGVVRNMVSSSRCAAGSGEFLVQQFGRMNLDLESGIRAARNGRRVALASRCSVHCKSDATHKLNKGECTIADIACSLIAELAAKIASLVLSTGWPNGRIIAAGGLAQCAQLIEELATALPGGQIEVVPASGYLEALGAAVIARREALQSPSKAEDWLQPTHKSRFETRVPLSQFTQRVIRLEGRGPVPTKAGMPVILGVDAGSTTTKAVLMDRESLQTVAGCYLRTHGNPVQAAFHCLAELDRQIAGVPLRIVQAAATGSGRDLVSVYLDGCLIFNEILAHARAAREASPAVDTLFELGGQDAKFVTMQSGIPVDYSMNDGCSAGTGSFLEEAAASDMQVPITDIGPLALQGMRPLAFGERCAAFINSEVRTALQQGVARPDVLAGLVYAIVDNYLARVVGARHIGRTILLQGGVALNPALGPAVSALTGMKVFVPPQPELMGALGAAQMAADLLAEGRVAEWDRDLRSFKQTQMETKEPFICPTCENRCEVQRIALNQNTYAFGGLCSRWEMQRRPKNLRQAEGRDLVTLRHEMMFKTFAPAQPAEPWGRIGLPLALSTYELYPLYASLLAGLGYKVVLSRPGHGQRRTHALMCYPAELMHAAVDDLLAQNCDYIFLPYMHEFPAPAGHDHGFLCPVTQDMPGTIRAFFERAADRFLMPEMGLAEHLARTTEQEVVRLGARLGVGEVEAKRAWSAALAHQAEYEKHYHATMDAALAELAGPAVILLGRPYAAFAPEVNLSIPRKIASRGFAVIPGDALPLDPSANRRNVWHFTQRVQAGVDYARQSPERYVCNLSCFSCGPDAITHHRLRRELEGQPFCFVEIDSHTAHAGIETRIGAFLDIIEERRQRRSTVVKTRTIQYAHTRLEEEHGNCCIVTGTGRRLSFEHPDVVHVLITDSPPISIQMRASLLASIGRRAVVAPRTSAEILQRARQACSGRECLPFLSSVGKMVSHLEKRPENEVSIFYLLEQEGPCQIGSWYDAASIIFERLGYENVLVAWPTIKNNYLGSGEKGVAVAAAMAIIGDLMSEVRSSLRCLARDQADSLSVLDELERGLLDAGRRGFAAIERELRRIARRLAEIPLQRRIEDAPRVLLFGGINRIYVDGPVREFFETRGILAKTVELSEFIMELEAEPAYRLGFARGRVSPASQRSTSAMVRELFSGKTRRDSRRALRAHFHVQFIEMLDKRWRRIMAGSGLLFNPHLPFAEIVALGHKHVSLNSFTEAPFTVGSYEAALKSGAFDGFVNVGAFNCAPANTASAVIHPFAMKSDSPYAIIEADGSGITASQLRQLETVAAQCQRRRLRQKQTLSMQNDV